MCVLILMPRLRILKAEAYGFGIRLENGVRQCCCSVERERASSFVTIGTYEEDDTLQQLLPLSPYTATAYLYNKLVCE
jgi:hypothetical protein